MTQGRGTSLARNSLWEAGRELCCANPVIPKNYGFRVVQVTVGMNSIAMAVPNVNYAVRNIRQTYNLLSLAQFYLFLW